MPIHEASTGAGLSGDQVQQEAARAAHARLDEFSDQGAEELLEEHLAQQAELEKTDRMDEMELNANLRGELAEHKAELAKQITGDLRHQISGGINPRYAKSTLNKQKELRNVYLRNDGFASTQGNTVYRGISEDKSGDVSADAFVNGAEVPQQKELRSPKTIADQRQAERDRQQ